MGQLFYQDSGAMIHQGKTLTQYQSEPMWSLNPDVHAIADSDQEFPDDWETGGRWLFIPSLGKFFRRLDDLHPILVAASTLFTSERWEEIEDLLDEVGNVNLLLRRKHFKKLRRKVQRARSKGLITVDEAQKLASVSAHLPNGS
jgi:hypothetical protein